ncbi:twin transmembrane helix small protein [Pontibaca methylaminivorans]|uniref:twin transmembrane helix small protein n=1 Tax=Pontibaca methylaminivorans TaxID=515897 RepID=UPI002FDABE49
MDDPFFFVVAGTVVLTAIVLMIGLGAFTRGGEFNRKYGNLLMRLRLLAQFIAVVLIALYVWIHGFGG